MDYRSETTRALLKEAEGPEKAYRMSLEDDMRKMIGKCVRKTYWSLIKFTGETKLSGFPSDGSSGLALLGISISDRDAIPGACHGMMSLSTTDEEIPTSEFDTAFNRVVSKLKDIGKIQGE